MTRQECSCGLQWRLNVIRGRRKDPPKNNLRSLLSFVVALQDREISRIFLFPYVNLREKRRSQSQKKKIISGALGSIPTVGDCAQQHSSISHLAPKCQKTNTLVANFTSLPSICLSQLFGGAALVCRAAPGNIIWHLRLIKAKPRFHTPPRLQCGKSPQLHTAATNSVFHFFPQLFLVLPLWHGAYTRFAGALWRRLQISLLLIWIQLLILSQAAISKALLGSWSAEEVWDWVPPTGEDWRRSANLQTVAVM